MSNGTYPHPDINAISLISNGDTLNSTIWLSDTFKQLSVNNRLDSFQGRLQILVVNLTNNNNNKKTTLDEFANKTLNLLNIHALISCALQDSVFSALLYHENMVFSMELQSQSQPPIFILCNTCYCVLPILIRLAYGKRIDVHNAVMQTIMN